MSIAKFPIISTLGVTIDQKFNWSSHVNILTAKIRYEAGKYSGKELHSKLSKTYPPTTGNKSGALDNYFRVNRQQHTESVRSAAEYGDEMSSEDSSTDLSTDLSESEESGSTTEIEDEYEGDESAAASS
eukprot:g43097.t1